ncbi:hypothetical protein [Mangrovimonas futianensis]|uniref:hypothetical protein n=1 Tax=Mangrovimonas futianensis TaxID=2895523 RepID=UPI001E33F652|nr:hypothetical protein [Mangrovimonas futianensis]MCF1420843.1 hypothetical protein [Mangrovimonas futianensis]
MEFMQFGYIEPEECIERPFGKSLTDDYLAIPQEDLFNTNKVFSDNFKDGKDKYLVLKISIDDNDITPFIPDSFSACLSKPQKLLTDNINELRFLVYDYKTIFGTRYSKFRNYNPRFFNCEERVLFESLLIKFKENEFKTFRWEKSKIGYELGIKRGKRDSIISRFITLGIIKSAVAKACKGPNNRNANSYFFNLDCQKILDLMPEIFSDYHREDVEHDLHRYLAPAFEE